jgi:hypothetical protein
LVNIRVELTASVAAVHTDRSIMPSDPGPRSADHTVPDLVNIMVEHTASVAAVHTDRSIMHSDPGTVLLRITRHGEVHVAAGVRTVIGSRDAITNRGIDTVRTGFITSDRAADQITGTSHRSIHLLVPPSDCLSMQTTTERSARTKS